MIFYLSDRMAFSRSTLFEACTFLGRVFGYHGQFEDMVLRWELDNLEERTGSIDLTGDSRAKWNEREST